MSIDITQIRLDCDGTTNGRCVASPRKTITLGDLYRYFQQYEWGRPLEENIGKLFKTYHHNLDDIYEGNLETPPELDGWEFESDGITCTWTRCPYCSKIMKEEE